MLLIEDSQKRLSQSMQELTRSFESSVVLCNLLINWRPNRR